MATNRLVTMEIGMEMQGWDDNGGGFTRKDESTVEYRKVDLTDVLEFYTFSLTGPNLPCLTREGLAVEAWIRNKQGLLPSFLAKDLVVDEMRDPWLRKFMVLLIKDHKSEEELRSNYLVKFYVERSVLRDDDEYLHCIERPNDGCIGVHLSEEVSNSFRTGFHHYTNGSRRLLYILDGIRFTLPTLSTRKRKFVNGTHVQIGIVETDERVTSYIPPNHSIGILDDCVDSVLTAIFRKAACRETGSLPASLSREPVVRAMEVRFLLPGKPRPRRRASKVRRRRLERRLRTSSSEAQSMESTTGIPRFDDMLFQPDASKRHQEEVNTKEFQPEAPKPQQEESDSRPFQPDVSKSRQKEVNAKEFQPEAPKPQQEEGDSKEAYSDTPKSQLDVGDSRESQSEAKQPTSKEVESKNYDSPRKKMAVRFDLPGQPCSQGIKSASQLTDSDAKDQLGARTGGCQSAVGGQKNGEAAQADMKEGCKPIRSKRTDSRRVKFQLPQKMKEVHETSTAEEQEALKSALPATLESTNTKPARPSRGKRLRAFLASLFSCVSKSKHPHKTDNSQEILMKNA